jgi:membrane protein insertase Oxa1/YidC/SpoIIIJ
VILCIIGISAIINTFVYGVALGTIRGINTDCFPSGPERESLLTATSTLTYQVISNVVVSFILVIVIILMIVFGNLNQSLTNLKSNFTKIKSDIDPHLETIKQKIAEQLTPVPEK